MTNTFELSIKSDYQYEIFEKDYNNFCYVSLKIKISNRLLYL
uniref:Uncharacterized protein n=1 Tax=Rhizophora mucronata TaxID=61149 RepID=A0A2P2MY31_RHIMU